METNNQFKTKISMIDIGKKICIKYPEINELQDILYYFYRFYYHNKKKEIVNKYQMYEYYELNRPNDDWFNKCIEKNMII